jgi:hypothetical protein
MRKTAILAGLIALLAFGHGPSAAQGQVIASQDEARVVAENWLRFVVERDGDWAGSTTPSIGEFRELTRDGLLLGYYASVEPLGYMVISSLKDFAPIKSYSTTSDLDPDEDVGMSALLKDELESRAKFLIQRFGGLDDVSLGELHKFTPDANRLEWSYLQHGGTALRANLESVYPRTAGKYGQYLLKTSWSQNAPYNNDCPNMSCGGPFNQNAPVGCVPLAMAQIMRYYAWPPTWQGEAYDWPNMLSLYRYAPTHSPPFVDENYNPVTWAQIDAVADLCRDAGTALQDISYSCTETAAYTCDAWYHNASDAFRESFSYRAECNDASDDTPDQWWQMIKEQVDLNRPVQYRIHNEGYSHSLVVDGYDTGYMVHANYGHDDKSENVWYTIDNFDCKGPPCNWNETKMIRGLYPTGGLCGTYSGILGPWGGFGTLYHYVYCDTASNNLTVQGGARVQFLPGTKISSLADDLVNIYGAAPNETRFFSDGLPTRGLRVATGGGIKLRTNGSIRVY